MGSGQSRSKGKRRFRDAGGAFRLRRVVFSRRFGDTDVWKWIYPPVCRPFVKMSSVDFLYQRYELCKIVSGDLREGNCERSMKNFVNKLCVKRDFFIDNLLVRIHFIIEMILVDQPGADRERLVFHCRTTSASTAPCTSRRICCPTHCASYCAPCHACHAPNHRPRHPEPPRHHPECSINALGSPNSDIRYRVT